MMKSLSELCGSTIAVGPPTAGGTNPPPPQPETKAIVVSKKPADIRNRDVFFIIIKFRVLIE